MNRRQSRDQQAEITWPEVAVRWEPALVTRPNPASLSLESPQLESAGKVCLKSAVGTSVTCTHLKMYGIAETEETHLGEGETSLAIADRILK